MGYEVNTSFMTEKLPYSQIYGTKVGTSYEKRRPCLRNYHNDARVGPGCHYKFGVPYNWAPRA